MSDLRCRHRTSDVDIRHHTSISDTRRRCRTSDVDIGPHTSVSDTRCPYRTPDVDIGHQTLVSDTRRRYQTSDVSIGHQTLRHQTRYRTSDVGIGHRTSVPDIGRRYRTSDVGTGHPTSFIALQECLMVDRGLIKGKSFKTYIPRVGFFKDHIKSHITSPQRSTEPVCACLFNRITQLMPSVCRSVVHTKFSTHSLFPKPSCFKKRLGFCLFDCLGFWGCCFFKQFVPPELGGIQITNRSSITTPTTTTHTHTSSPSTLCRTDLVGSTSPHAVHSDS